MSTIVVDTTCVHIPSWVTDLASFRRWAHSDEFPESGRICWLGSEVWLDMSKEQFFSHNQVKGEFTSVLTSLVKVGRLGRYSPDGMLLTHPEAKLSTVPDGVFVSQESFQRSRVRLAKGAEEGYVELEGSPDMVREVVSPSSVEKDTVTLRSLYWKARIPEYWLVDARGTRLVFDILRRTSRGYVATRGQKGWLQSVVFDRSFRLTRQTDELGEREFTL